ncbi:MAG: sulfatase-like hydrolase/transferase [Acidobacteriota bacterium]|jgi:arylsulfatase A-like enzyme|nr:sulfatase-like hydrolase/transferase [Acidobacteriota bacterium]
MGPNFLMIYCDELRADVFGHAGHPRVRTPRLDELAASSMVFDRCYVPCPICMPSRSALATGRYPRSNGCVDNATPSLAGESSRSLYRLLADAGWRTENVGKYHLGWPVSESGFSHHEPVHSPFGPFGPSDPALRRRAQYKRLEGDLPIIVWGTSPLSPEESYAALTVDAGLRRLSQYSGSEPFFLRVAINMPHTPYAPPRPYSEWYDPADEPLPDSYGDGIESKPTLVQLFYASRRYADLTPDDVRRSRCSYYGLVSYIDHEVGRLLDALDDHGMWDDTIVVFTADHGTCVGEHGWIEKWAQLWEETCRVPLMVSGSGLPSGRSQALVQQMDLMPTILRLAGQDPPDAVQGRSLEPIFADPTSPFREAVFAETFVPALMTEPAVSVRTNDWKLTRYPKMADIEARLPGDHPYRGHPMFDPENLVEGELYDLATDPSETRNLLLTGASGGVCETLDCALDKWQDVCEPALDWSRLTPPANFHWSQQRLMEGATLRNVAKSWAEPPQVVRRTRTDR